MLKQIKCIYQNFIYLMREPAGCKASSKRIWELTFYTISEEKEKGREINKLQTTDFW